jgi:2-polyprenyl-3-methyl-5-hydroxy-6-metoxy-1,4-benzoquinol methylase
MPASTIESPELFALTRQVANRYAGASHYARNFVRGKLLTDPATPAILRLASAGSGFGTVADLGCGRGQVGLALLTAGLADRVHGLDLNVDKIRDATRAAAGLPATFAVADLCQAAVPESDTVLIFDVLLQMPEPAQRGLIMRIASAARRRIVIRAFDPDRGWRAGLGITMEQLGRRIRRDGSVFKPMPVRNIAAPLQAQGFRVSVAPCWGWTPLPNVMLVGERTER